MPPGEKISVRSSSNAPMAGSQVTSIEREREEVEVLVRPVEQRRQRGEQDPALHDAAAVAGAADDGHHEERERQRRNVKSCRDDDLLVDGEERAGDARDARPEMMKASSLEAGDVDAPRRGDPLVVAERLDGPPAL